MKKVVISIMVLLGLLAAMYGFAGEKEMLVCPVMGEKITPENAVMYEHKGNTYTFCCKDCVTKFKKNPDQYIGKARQPLSGEVKKGGAGN